MMVGYCVRENCMTIEVPTLSSVRKARMYWSFSFSSSTKLEAFDTTVREML